MVGGDLSKGKDPILIKEAFGKLSGDEIAALIRAISLASSENAPKLGPAPRVKLPPIGVSAMIQEETRIRPQAGAGRLPWVESALALSNSGNSRSKVETRECYNCGEIGHLKSACTKPPKVNKSGRRGQSEDRGCSRGRRGSGRGGYRANLMVAEEEEEEGERDEDLSAEDQELLRSYSQVLRRRQRGTVEDVSTLGNIASYAHSAAGIGDTHALASIPTTRSPWIVDSGASRHVTGAAGEFSSYTHLANPESIQTADGTAQPVVGKGTVRCTNSLTLSNVLHAPSFPVNLLSISAIILQLKCVVSFDIPKVIF